MASRRSSDSSWRGRRSGDRTPRRKTSVFASTPILTRLGNGERTVRFRTCRNSLPPLGCKIRWSGMLRFMVRTKDAGDAGTPLYPANVARSWITRLCCRHAGQELFLPRDRGNQGHRTSSYLRDHSEPSQSHYVFAYFVRIENVGTMAAQLLTRRWLIHDSVGDGIDTEVIGEGVVESSRRSPPAPFTNIRASAS